MTTVHPAADCPNKNEPRSGRFISVEAKVSLQKGYGFVLATCASITTLRYDVNDGQYLSSFVKAGAKAFL